MKEELMAFDNLPYQSPFQTAEASNYASEILILSKSVSEKSRCVLDVAYGHDYWQRMDIYLPDDASKKNLPVLMFAHGGGWTHGYKEWMGFMAPPIVSLPAIFASVSYRLAPVNRYPDPMRDCFSAVEWVYKNIQKLGGSPNRVFIGGHSAGGHLGSLVALRKDITETLGLPSNVIKGCFPVSTPFDMRADDPESGSDEERLHLFLRGMEDGEEASPICHVAGNSTPFFIVCGSMDLEWVVKTTPQMVAALKGQSGIVESHVFEGLNHFETNLALRHESNSWVKKVREWMSNF
jgi:acetyl esterase/lipase